MAVIIQPDARAYPADALSVAAEATGNYRLRYVDDGGVAWGAGFGQELRRSTDDWATHAGIHVFDESIQYMQHLANGEMIVSTGFGSAGEVRGELFLSSGFAADPEAATWAKVLEASTDKNRFNHWGLHAWGQYVVAGEYGDKGSPETSARRVWFSSDYGQTFTVIFDLRDFYPDPDPFDNAHVHAAHIDKWRERIWVAVGDTGYRGIYYRALAGGDWTLVGNERQPTTITATPTAVLFGTDSFPNGVLRWTEAAGLRQAYTINPGVTSLTHVAQAGVRDPDSGVVLIAFSSSGSGDEGVLLATADDGRTIHAIHRVPVAQAQHGFQAVTRVTPSARVLAHYRDASYPDGALMVADAPEWVGAALAVTLSGALRFEAP